MLLYQSKGYQDMDLTRQSSMWSCQTKSATRCFPKRGTNGNTGSKTDETP